MSSEPRTYVYMCARMPCGVDNRSSKVKLDTGVEGIGLVVQQMACVIMAFLSSSPIEKVRILLSSVKRLQERRGNRVDSLGL